MLFNSIEFALFLPAVFLLYWFVFNKSIQIQNSFLVVASFFFYGWWDWRFLFLLVFSAGIDFIAALLIANTNNLRKKKIFLLLSIVTNLSILGFFKYFNFFVDNFVSAFRLFGQELQPFTLHIILPVGVSFYTFQALSYTIDVYRGKMTPTKDLGAYMAFISFFPQLVAGPIERATNLLPQFLGRRVFDYQKAVDGLRQILWGLFKKIVVADNCAKYADMIFNGHVDYNGSTLLLGAFFFAFQIYGDFSGYSDIAIGTARLFGFSLMQNFAFPYFARDIAEFWRRWHISLTTWFRDYVYIPLGGSKGGTWAKVRNTFVIFLISGFWHGANWTFIVWGALNAIYFLPLLLANKNRVHLENVAAGSVFPPVKDIAKMVFTFMLTVFAWIFFRSGTLDQAGAVIGKIFSIELIQMPSLLPGLVFLNIGSLIVVEWLQREKQHGLEFSGNNLPTPARWSIYLVLIFWIAWLGGAQQEFIYFDF